MREICAFFSDKNGQALLVSPAGHHICTEGNLLEVRERKGIILFHISNNTLYHTEYSFHHLPKSEDTNLNHLCWEQGTHCTGKTGEMVKKKIPVREKPREFRTFCQNTGKTQEIWFAQVVNSLILKVKDFSIFATKIPKLFLKLDMSTKSVWCV